MNNSGRSRDSRSWVKTADREQPRRQRLERQQECGHQSRLGSLIPKVGWREPPGGLELSAQPKLSPSPEPDDLIISPSLQHPPVKPSPTVPWDSNPSLDHYCLSAPI